VKSFTKLSDTAGGFTAAMANNMFFGSSVVGMGDIDDDGTNDIAVGGFHPDNFSGAGRVWVIFLRTNGQAKGHQEISSNKGGFTGTLDSMDAFGHSVANAGDCNGDSVPDLIVGAYSDDDGGSSRGALWLLMLKTNG